MRGESQVELRIRSIRPVLTVMCMDRATPQSGAHRAVTSDRADAGVPVVPRRLYAVTTSGPVVDGKPGGWPPTTCPQSCRREPRAPVHYSDRARYLNLLASALVFAALVLFGASVEVYVDHRGELGNPPFLTLLPWRGLLICIGGLVTTLIIPQLIAVWSRRAVAVARVGAWLRTCGSASLALSPRRTCCGQ